MKDISQPLRVSYAQPKRMEYLDSIRGLAALSVLLGHEIMAFAWPPDLLGWGNLPFLNMLVDGRSAVTMFFVLSGFVLAHPYLAPPEEGREVRQLFIPTFYLRRITRIWLPWAFAFGLSLLARRWFFSPVDTVPPISHWLTQFWHAPVSAASVFHQCFFGLHDATQLLLPQDWSLGVELRGSLLIPLFIILVRRSTLALAGLAGLILIFHPTGQYYLSFALGVWAAKYYHRAELLRTLGFGIKCLILGVGILLYQNRLLANHYWTNEHFTGLIDKIVWCVTSVGCVLILMATLGSRRIQGKLHLPPVLLLGRVSFSVYLLQFIVILCFLPWLIRWLNTAGLHSPPLVMLTTVVLGALATIALAVGMYYAVEVPSMDLGRRLTKLVQRQWVKFPLGRRPN
jgi:peptidoglycan/LPS O-acetylase OafA/YrhL